MVPDKFNMVDMEGIDILSSYEDIIPGLYQKLVESITQCRYQCLYNWYFDSVLIPPTYVEMVVNQDTNDVWINDRVFVTSDDCLSLHLPSIETSSGSVVYITDALSRKIEELICYINPLQTGSGDPSPDNIRPISGWVGVNVYRESSYDTEDDPTVTVNWESVAGTVYAGTLHVISGRLLVTHKIIDLGTIGYAKNTGSIIYFYSGSLASEIKPSIGPSAIPDALCSELRVTTVTNILNGVHDGIAIAHEAAIYPGRLMIHVQNYDNMTASEFKNAMSGVMFCYPLATPIEYQLTPQEMTTLLGNNVIWHDANGDVSVTYWKE